MQAVNAALVTPRDLVVGISHSGETRDVVSALRLAKSKGATTVALSGNSSSALCEQADIKLVTVSHEEPIYGDFMEAKIAQLFVIDLLYIGVLLRDIPVFKRNLDSTARAIWDRSGGPWGDWHQDSDARAAGGVADATARRPGLALEPQHVEGDGHNPAPVEADA
jgi:hypothetical protein